MKLVSTIIPGSDNESRKAQVLVITSLLTVFGQKLGLDPAIVEKIMYLAMTYIGGQGLADMGKGTVKALPGQALAPQEESSLPQPKPIVK